MLFSFGYFYAQQQLLL